MRILPLIALFSSSVLAGEHLHNVMFFPDEGNIVVRTGLEYAGESKNTINGSSNTAIKTHENHLVWQNHILYVFDGQWELGVKLNYQFKGTTEIEKYSQNEYNSAPSEVYLNKEIQNKGLQDIVITNRYAILTGNIQFNIMADLSISPDDHKDGSYTLIGEGLRESGGNAVSGGHAIHLGAEFGHDKNDFQWRAYGRLSYNFERDGITRDAKGSAPNYRNQEWEIDPHADLMAGADFLYKYDEKWSFGGGFDFTSHGEEEKVEDTITVPGERVTETSEQHQSWTFRPRADYLLREDISLNATLYYTQFEGYDVKTTTRSNTGVTTSTSGKVEDHSETGLKLGAIFRF